MTAPNMADMPYHFGIKLAAHPTQKQKNIIKRNSDASRFVYNALIGIDQEMFQLKQVDCYISLAIRITKNWLITLLKRNTFL